MLPESKMTTLKKFYNFWCLCGQWKTLTAYVNENWYSHYENNFGGSS